MIVRGFAAFRAIVGPDVQADRVVPATGFTASLVVFSAAAMTFLAVFALAFVLAFSKSIPNPSIRKLFQGLSFLPAVAAAILLRPAAFATVPTVALSTSQFIALASAVGFGVTFAPFASYKVKRRFGVVTMVSSLVLSRELRAGRGLIEAGSSLIEERSCAIFPLIRCPAYPFAVRASMVR